jgi:hypothetical protein
MLATDYLEQTDVPTRMKLPDGPVRPPLPARPKTRRCCAPPPT